MTDPTDTVRGVTVRLSETGQPPVRDGAPTDRLLTVLFETGIEEWRRGWRASPGSGPSQEAIVSASDTTREATATTQVVPGQQLAYTLLDASASLDCVIDAASMHAAETDGEVASIVVDDIVPVLENRGVAATRIFVTALRGLTDGTDVVIGCSYRSDVAADVRALFDPTAVAGRVDHPIVGALDRLRRADPTTFGYVRRHWEEAREGIECSTRNYPQSRQVHTTLSDPETTPRTLGTTLSGLVHLGVLDTLGETVGSTRYDLTVHDPDRMWVVGAAISAWSHETTTDEEQSSAADW